MNTVELQLYDVGLSNNVDKFIAMKQTKNMVINNYLQAPLLQTNLQFI